MDAHGILNKIENFFISRLNGDLVEPISKLDIRLMKDPFVLNLLYITFPDEYEKFTLQDMYSGTQGEIVLQKAVNSNDQILSLIALLHHMTSHETIATCASLLIAKVDIIPDLVRFWTVLSVMQKQCEGSLGTTETAAIVSRGVLTVVGKMSKEFMLHTRYFMQCDILQDPTIEMCKGMILYGSSAAKVSDPVKTNDHLSIAQFMYDGLKDAYNKGLKLHTFRDMLSTASDSLLSTLAHSGSNAYKRVMTLLMDPENRAKLQNAKTKASFIGEAVLRGLGESGINVGTSIWYGAHSSRDFTKRTMQQAYLLLIGTGDYVIRSTISQPRIGAATVHTILPDIDNLIKCSQYLPENMIEFGTQTNCTVPDSIQIQTRIEKEIVHVPIEVKRECPPCPSVICPVCPVCPTYSTVATSKRAVSRAKGRSRSKSKTRKSVRKVRAKSKGRKSNRRKR